jgi:hypothetical protein
MAAGEVEEPARAKVAFLGVSTAPIDPALAAHLGLETGELVVIEDRDFIVGDGEVGEFIFEEGEPPLPPTTAVSTVPTPPE